MGSDLLAIGVCWVHIVVVLVLIRLNGALLCVIL